MKRSLATPMSQRGLETHLMKTNELLTAILELLQKEVQNEAHLSDGSR